MVIWKYEIPINDYSPLSLAAGYKILCVLPGTKPHYIRLYVQHTDPLGPQLMCRIEIHGTGHEFGKDDVKRQYIGSVDDGPFVWHVFECLL